MYCYFLRYVVKIDDKARFMTTRLLTNKRYTSAQIEFKYRQFCPVIAEDSRTQERIKSHLLSIREAHERAWDDA